MINKTIKVVIIDDEPLARFRIRDLLDQTSGVEILAEAKNGSDALEKIDFYQPDLIFLDIRMPDFDGFDVLKKVFPKLNPYIIFVTAFDEYAIKAFETNAVDYLLKPFNEERFFKALDKAKQQIELKKTHELNNKLFDVLKNYYRQNEKDVVEIVIDKNNTKVKLIDIIYFEADGNYVKIKTGKKKFIFRKTINEIEETYGSDRFIRIHRSFVINKSKVRDITYKKNNEFEIKLSNNETFTSGRKYSSEIKEWYKSFHN